MTKFYRAVVYLKDDLDKKLSLERLKSALEDVYIDRDYTIREFKETNVHKFNRAKDNEVEDV